MSFTGRVALRLVFACVLLAVAGTGAAASSPPSLSASFFHMSPIKASAVPGAAALRLSVSLARVPANDAPAITWGLTLGRPGGPATPPPAVCSNARLPGGERVTPDHIVWRNQGLSFLWYGGSAPCRATVAVLAENESEQCSASLSLPVTAARSGSAAVCRLGGFTFGSSVLPVPAAVLHGYASAPTELARLVSELRRGTLTKAAFEQLIAPLLRSQKTSFSTLFPPVFGCSFARLFDPLVAAQSGLDGRLAQAGAGSSPSVSADSAALQAAAQAAAACKASAGDPAGASPGAVEELARLANQAKGLLAATPGAEKTGLAALSARLETTLRHGFPAVFGIPYATLVGRVAAVDAAISRARQSALAGDNPGAAAALAGAIAPDRAIHQGLVRHQRHVIAVEYATS